MSLKSMLHDKDIREPLFDFLEETYEALEAIDKNDAGGEENRAVTRGCCDGHAESVVWN